MWNYLNFKDGMIYLVTIVLFSSYRVISAQITQTIKPQKIDFAHFWCTDSPSGDMQKSRIFLLYDAYFGFYGGLKFGPPGVPPNLWKAITWPVVELERQSWCQSSSFGPKNLIQQKKW